MSTNVENNTQRFAEISANLGWGDVSLLSEATNVSYATTRRVLNGNSLKNYKQKTIVLVADFISKRRQQLEKQLKLEVLEFARQTEAKLNDIEIIPNAKTDC